MQTLVPIVACDAEKSPRAQSLGAARIAASLSADPQVSSRADIILIRIEPEPAGARLESFRRQLSALDAAVPLIGFSVFVWNRDLLVDCARLVRQTRPETVLFAGGPEVTADPASLWAEGVFDALIAGNGEAASVTLARDVLTGTRTELSGLLRDGRTAGRAATCSLDSLPNPYDGPWLDVGETGGALWELTRGCPYGCTYCYESKGDRKLNPLDMKRAEAELDLLYSRGVSQIFILDPTFNANASRCLAVLDLLYRKAPDLHYDIEIRAELLTRAQAKAFSRLFVSLQIGLQSAHPAVLENVGRSFSPDVFAGKLRLLDEAGVVFGLDLIYGLPGDTLEGYRESLDYAIERQPNHLDLFRLSVLPGTVLRDDAERFGLEYGSRSPYGVISSPGFPAADIESARRLSEVCSLVYNEGRAVGWFILVCRMVNLRPSEFLQAALDSGHFTPEKTGMTRDAAGQADRTCVQEQILIFLHEITAARSGRKMTERNIHARQTIASDIVRFHWAVGDAGVEGEESRLELGYHPDLLASLSVDGLSVLASRQSPGLFRVWVGPDGEGDIAWQVLS